MGGGRYKRRRLAALTCWLLGAPIFAVVTPAVAAPDPAEVERLAQTFFRSPRFSLPELSPDGKRLAVYFREAGREMIVVRELPDGQPRPVVQLPDPEARLSWIHWASEHRLLFGVEEPMAGVRPPRPRRTRLYGIDADGSNHVHLARNWAQLILVGHGDFQHEDDVVDFLDDDPGHILISIRKPTEYYPGVYKLNVTTGGLERVVVPMDGVSRWYSDHLGRVRAGYGYEHGAFKTFARKDPKGQFVQLSSQSLGESGISFEGFSPKPEILLVSAEGDGDRSRLYEFDLENLRLGREIFAHERVDVPSWLELSETGVLEAVGFLADGPERHFVDPAAARRQKLLDNALPGRFNRVVSETPARDLAIVLSDSDVRAPEYLLLNRTTKKMELLFARYPTLRAKKLAPMRHVVIESRDGLTIPAYLTEPIRGKGEAADQKPPAIIYPHGGPSARDYRSFDLVVQYFASLGFVVLQPNFRGSTGYGSEFLAAGFQEWGLAMQDDLTDSVEWLVEAGLVDPDRVCIYGASYGGYAALMGLVKTPKRFRCAGAYAAPTDLVMMLKHDRGYMFSDQNAPLVGKTSKDRARLHQTSPLLRAGLIRSPVFLAHGEDDERVHVAHATKLAKALKKQGTPVELMLIPHEAHSFRDEARRIEYYSRLGQFLIANTRPRQSP